MPQVTQVGKCQSSLLNPSQDFVRRHTISTDETLRISGVVDEFNHFTEDSLKLKIIWPSTDREIVSDLWSKPLSVVPTDNIRIWCSSTENWLRLWVLTIKIRLNVRRVSCLFKGLPYVKDNMIMYFIKFYLEIVIYLQK